MGEETINYCKQIVLNHTLIIILCLFLIVYIVINYNLISEGNIYGGNLPKTIIITGVIFLILYIFIIWDDEENDNTQYDEELVLIPKYKIVNKINIKENSPVKEQQIENNYKPELKIENKYNNKYTKENSSNKQENSNIFISHKNKAKFGIKF
jgi:hypothetical protein